MNGHGQMTVVVPQSGVMNLVPPSTSVGSYRRAAMSADGPPPRPSTPVYNAEGTDPHRDARRVAVLALYHLYTVREKYICICSRVTREIFFNLNEGVRRRVNR